MKNNKIIALAAALVGLWGCSDGAIPNGDGPSTGSGLLQLTLEPGAAIVIVSGASKAAPTVDVSGFAVQISDEKGEQTTSYSSYSEVPAELALEAGQYTLSAANNGTQKGAAFDRPYYAGSAPFTVKVGEVTPVSVLCDLKSTGVVVKYTDKMLSELTDILISVWGSEGTLPYTPSETRTGWFPVPSDGQMFIGMSGTLNGKHIYNSLPLSKVSAKELRTVWLDIKTSGSSKTTITIDKTIIKKDVTLSVPDADDTIDNNGDTGSWEEGGDPVQPSGLPTIVGKSWEGNPFDIEKTVTIDPNAIKILDVLMSSSASDGIENLWLEIDSELLKGPLEGLFGITGPIDLANPDPKAQWFDPFVELGIIDPESPIKGKREHLFSVGGLLGMLGPIDPTGGTPHRFKLKVIDKNGTTEKTLTVELFYQ